MQGDEPSPGLPHEFSAQCRWSPILPKPLRLLTAPAAYGLHAVRTATWVAAILMTAVGLRAGCFSLVDASVLAAQRYRPCSRYVVPSWQVSHVSGAFYGHA